MPELTARSKKRIGLMYENGISVKDIARDKDMSILDVEQIIIDEGYIKRITPRSTGILGSKTEPYFESEEQMLNPPVYEYNELTKEEKKFYESRNDK
jgi:hypothetical protein